MLNEKLERNFQKAIEKKIRIVTKCVKKQEDKLFGQIEHLVKVSLCDTIYPNALVNPSLSKSNIDYGCLSDTVRETDILDTCSALLTTIVNLEDETEFTISVWINVADDMNINKGDFQIQSDNWDADGFHLGQDDFIAKMLKNIKQAG